MKFHACRDNAVIVPIPNTRRVELRAVMLREYLNPKRLTPIAHRGHSGDPQLKLQPGVIYAGHTGICITDGSIDDLTFRATAAAWLEQGMCIVRAELVPYQGGTLPELVIYFYVAIQGEQAPNPAQSLFQLVLPNGHPLPTSVESTQKAPPPGIKYAADKVVPPRPAAAGQEVRSQTPTHANPEAKAAAWLRTPDTRGHVVSEGPAQVMTNPAQPIPQADGTPATAALSAPPAAANASIPVPPAGPVPVSSVNLPS